MEKVSNLRIVKKIEILLTFFDMRFVQIIRIEWLLLINSAFLYDIYLLIWQVLIKRRSCTSQSENFLALIATFSYFLFLKP